MLNIVEQLPRVAPVPTRPTSAIDGLGVHHSGDEGNPWGWAGYHTSAPVKGGPAWGPAATIGYHHAIMRDGTVYKTANNNEVTPGVANHNWHLIHVVLQGRLDVTHPTLAQIRELLQLCRIYMGAYGFGIDRCRTHGEWQTDPAWATTCPGIRSLGEHIRFMLAVGIK